MLVGMMASGPMPPVDDVTRGVNCLPLLLSLYACVVSHIGGCCMLAVRRLGDCSAWVETFMSKCGWMNRWIDGWMDLFNNSGSTRQFQFLYKLP